MTFDIVPGSALVRRLRHGLLILAAAGALAACGFQPVFTAQDTGAGVMAPSADLAATQIRPIAGRRGQILHNLMLDRLNPRGRPRQPLYQLTTGLDVNVQSLGARADATSSRQQVEVIATARLDGVGEPQTFRARATSSYNTTESDYGSLVAQEDAIKRALNLIADELTVKIAAFFRNARAQT